MNRNIVFFTETHLKDHTSTTLSTGLGNTRVAIGLENDALVVKQVNSYYPFGMNIKGLTTGTSLRHEAGSYSKNEYLYNGKMFQDELGLDWLDFHARFYDPAIVRTTTQDPMAESFYSESPYSFMGNNPVVNIDPTGMNYNPIYDREGEFLGTDDKGLQGKAIVMDEKNFEQGMSHEEALSHSLGSEGLSSDDAKTKLLDHKAGLKDRPDWDGYITQSEGNDWYRNGGGQPLFADLSKLDLSGIYSLGENYVGQVKTFNLLLNSGSLNDGLVYGQVTFKRYPNHHVRAYADKYDFEMHNPKNPLNWPRNAETLIGRSVAGQGQKYEINLYGSKQLKPLFPWTK